METYIVAGISLLLGYLLGWRHTDTTIYEKHYNDVLVLLNQHASMNAQLMNQRTQQPVQFPPGEEFAQEDEEDNAGLEGGVL